MNRILQEAKKIHIEKSEDYWIAHTALQAMANQKHERLTPVYQWMNEKYKEDQTMQSNLRMAMENCRVAIVYDDHTGKERSVYECSGDGGI